MLPLSSLMYSTLNNTRHVLTSWKSNTDPSPGEFVAELTPQVPPQGLVWKGSSPYWRSGPWAETRFSGIPEMDKTYVNPLTMEQDVVKGTGVLTFCALRNFDVSYIKLTSDGSLDIHRSYAETTGWIKHFEGPQRSCDLYGTCGPYGLCISSTSTPTCKCLKGFVPKSDDKWNRGNWTPGCVRRTELSSCQGNSSSTTEGKDTTDGFYSIANIKPPDSYELASFGDAEKCQQGCHRNCSCLAFSYINGIGCLVWKQELLDMVQFIEEGESLSIRLARSELAGSKRIKIIAVSAICLCVFMILVLAAFGCWRYRLKQNGEARVAGEISEDSWRKDLTSQDVSGSNFFELYTIQTATDNFSLFNKLGQGGFGTVYKGKLEDGKEIAIKRLSSRSAEGTGEFMNELKLISKLQRRNLVRLLGYCMEGERLLAYEFMVNESLDTFIFVMKKKLELDWPKRFNIIQGIARGLLYLHRDSFLKVVHRDLKASNILFDEKMNPKISDFGLARMFQGTQIQDKTARIFGTLDIL